MKLLKIGVGAVLIIFAQLNAITPQERAAKYGLTDIIACEAISDDVSLVQLRTVSQKGDSCAYNAVKNACVCVRGFLSGIANLSACLNDSTIMPLWCGDPFENDFSLRHFVAQKEFKDKARKVLLNDASPCVQDMQNEAPFFQEYKACLSKMIDTYAVQHLTVDGFRNAFSTIINQHRFDADQNGVRAREFQENAAVRLACVSDEQLKQLIDTFGTVVEQSKSIISTDNVDADTVGALVEHVVKVSPDPLDPNRCFIVVAENVEHFDSPIYEALPIARAVKRLEEQCKKEEPFVGAFIVGSMRQEGDARGTYGHWITLVVRKEAGINGHRTYHTVCSLNNVSLLKQPFVRNFIDKVEMKMGYASIFPTFNSDAKLLSTKVQNNILSAAFLALLSYASWRWYLKCHAAQHNEHHAHDNEPLAEASTCAHEIAAF
jgi:hypothetical protein